MFAWSHVCVITKSSGLITKKNYLKTSRPDNFLPGSENWDDY